ncbi:MAG TPA: type IV pilus assembly protein PilM [Candidatus Omnitrophota bacterium]|nr:type IV pilus assembly protein PilM [Candidatus Omnitrophota bacterium]HPD84001.1 type IV pilus assembly protein PilM [Candidatus Omnitrophota bacterium]HRZ02858.1 type IV pilus assembly protein PilM [Candidatus Omnitrophota bacterium]
MFGAKKNIKKGEISLGVDIGNFSVKVAQLSSKDNKFTLEGFGYSKINTAKTDGVLEALKSACAEAKLSERRAVVAVPSQGVIVRYLMLPTMGEEELRKAMEFEIERYVPFDRKDVASDYLVIKENSDSRNMKVLLVAAKKEFVDSRVRVLKDAGLEPEVVTIDSIILKNIFQINYSDKKEKTVGLLNIGSKISSINIVRGSTSYFMRDVQLGGDNITQLLKEKFDIAPEEAEKIKCNLTLDDREKFKIIEPVLGNLLNEVYLSFDYYESEFGMVVDEVLVSGGTAKLAWLANFLKENLNREISVLNSIKNVTVSPIVSQQRLDFVFPSLAVPLGLALENFN